MATRIKFPLDYSEAPKNMNWFLGVARSLPALTYIPGTKGSAGTNDYCVELTTNNANLITTLIASDPDYNAGFSNKIFNYCGGSATFNGTTNQTIVLHVIRMIDYENSTNAWRMKKENKQSLLNIVAYICDASNKYWSRVSGYDADLIDDLAKAAKNYNGKIGVHAISLSSKVCRFFNRFCFGKDDYYAFDSVVRRTLPYFWCAYGLQAKVLPSSTSYKGLHTALDQLRSAASMKHGHSISRFGMDQIMWYCYK